MGHSSSSAKFPAETYQRIAGIFSAAHRAAPAAGGKANVNTIAKQAASGLTRDHERDPTAAVPGRGEWKWSLVGRLLLVR
jgi:hypothetical protein